MLKMRQQRAVHALLPLTAEMVFGLPATMRSAPTPTPAPPRKVIFLHKESGCCLANGRMRPQTPPPSTTNASALVSLRGRGNVVQLQ